MCHVDLELVIVFVFVVVGEEEEEEEGKVEVEVGEVEGEEEFIEGVVRKRSNASWWKDECAPMFSRVNSFFHIKSSK